MKITQSICIHYKIINFKNLIMYLFLNLQKSKFSLTKIKNSIRPATLFFDYIILKNFPFKLYNTLYLFILI